MKESKLLMQQLYDKDRELHLRFTILLEDIYKLACEGDTGTIVRMLDDVEEL